MICTINQKSNLIIFTKNSLPMAFLRDIHEEHLSIEKPDDKEF